MWRIIPRLPNIRTDDNSIEYLQKVQRFQVEKTSQRLVKRIVKKYHFKSE